VPKLALSIYLPSWSGQMLAPCQCAQIMNAQKLVKCVLNMSKEKFLPVWSDLTIGYNLGYFLGPKWVIFRQTGALLRAKCACPNESTYSRATFILNLWSHCANNVSKLILAEICIELISFINMRWTTAVTFPQVCEKCPLELQSTLR